MRHIKLRFLALAFIVTVGTVSADDLYIADGWYLTDGSGPYATNPAQCNGLRVLCSIHYIDNIPVEMTYQY